MAMQAGMGLTKVLILAGAGFTGSIVLRNGRLSDIVSELQTMIKGADKSGEGAADSDTLASQVHRLAMEIRQLSSVNPITVLNGGQSGNITALFVPAATLGALGYGYMWWKGLSFSDLMYVTKSSMANAVSSMTKHLEQVSNALTATKRHLTQRIENLDGKLDEQKAMSTEIKNEVIDARDKLTNVGYELNSLQQLVWGLNGKMNAIEDKQNFACAGVKYLCQFAEGKDGKIADFLQDGQKLTGKRAFLGCPEMKSLKGLQQIAETIESGDFDKTKTEAIFQNNFNSSNIPKGLPRFDLDTVVPDGLNFSPFSAGSAISVSYVISRLVGSLSLSI